MKKNGNFNIIKMIFIPLAFLLLLNVFIVLLGTLLITLFSNYMKKEREKEIEKVGTNQEVIWEMKSYLRHKYGDFYYEFVAIRRKSTWGILMMCWC